MLKRVRDWVQARIDAAILPQVHRCVTDVAQPIDYTKLAAEVTSLQCFMHELSALTASCDDLRAAVSRQVADRVIDQIDLGDIADKTAEMIYIEVDTDTIAEKVAEDIDVSECVDYDKLAEALVSKLKEAWA